MYNETLVKKKTRHHWAESGLRAMPSAEFLRKSRLRAMMHSAESLVFANCSATLQPYAKIV
jgi:hypothetical protein